MTRRLFSGVAALLAAAVLFAGYPQAQVAAPVVTSLSGVIADGATLQISGGAFGTKATAAPFRFDDFERGRHDALVDGWDIHPAGTTPTFSTEVTRANSGVSVRSNFVGGHWNSAIGIANTPLPRIYLDGWYYLDAPEPYSRNHKPFRITSQDNNEPHLDYVMFCNGPSLITSTVGVLDQAWLGLGPTDFARRWAHIQGYFEESSPNARDGVMKFWVDGVRQADQPVATRVTGDTRWENLWIGQYLGHDTDDVCAGIGDAYTYWDDVYVDTSQARVEIGDAPTYDGSRHREIQLPTAWNASSITIRVNQGSFTDLSNLYLYVTDSAGRVNDVGFPLVLTADQVPPAVISVFPPAGAAVATTTAVSATFDEPMDPARIGGATFELRDGFSLVSASVAYNASTRIVTLTPASALLPERTYTARIRGGAAGVIDEAGNGLATDYTWSFSTYGPEGPPGLVAAYSFDETSGEGVIDSSRGGNAGTITGGASRVAGHHGGAILFEGVDGVVTIPDTDAFDLTTGLTIEAWVRPDSLDQWRTVIIKQANEGLAYALYANDDTSTPTMNINTGAEDLRASGSFQVPIGAWTHLAATYDGAMMQLFVNGTAAGRRAANGPMIDSDGVLRIGGNSIWGEYFHGIIDDVRVYNRALSAMEIQVDMATAVPTLPPPPPPPPHDETVFGPVTYTSNGLPILSKQTFDVTDLTGEYSLRVTNSGVIAGVVALNGRVVLRPRDFVMSGGRGNDSDSFEEEWERIRKGKSQGSGIVPSIDIPVAVRPGANQIFVAFWAPRGASLTAEIVRSMEPPDCTIASPANGSIALEGDAVAVKVQAADNVRVTAVRFQSSDGSLDVTDRYAPYTAPFTVPTGVSEVTFTATAYDAAGNAGVCTSTVGVLQSPPPTVTIVSPGGLTPLVEGATIPVSAAVSARAAIGRVDFSVNGVVLASDVSAPYSFLFTVPAGVSWVSMRASAVDALGHSGTSEELIVPVVQDPLTTVAGRLVDRSGWPVVGAEVAADINGLSTEIFDFPDVLTAMPSLADRTASRTKVVSAANLRNPGFVFGADPFGFGPGSHAVKMSGHFFATDSGIYTFVLGVNEGGRLVIGGSTVVNLPTGTGVFQQGVGRVWLREGLVPIQILAFDNGNPEIQLSYIRAGDSLRTVPQAVLTPGRSPYGAISGANGLFAIPDVPAALGAVGAAAAYTPFRSREISGEADATEPLAGGTTEIGTIRLR